MIDVVILTWKRPSECFRCITSIINNSGDNISNIFVVINEDNPTYDVVRSIQDNRIHIISLLTNEGVVARNHGFDRCTADYIAQIDDDVIVNLGWDDKALQLLNCNVQAVGEQGGYIVNINTFTDNNIPGTNGQYVDLLTGFCWIFKNQGFKYDDSFGMHWHEESDLQFQMREAGYRFKVCEGLCKHLHQGKPNHWNEYLEINRQRIVNKWAHKKNELNLERISQ